MCIRDRSLTLDCSAWANRRLSGLLEVIIVIGNGVFTPASANSCLAFAGSCGLQLCAAGEVNSLFGEIGEQATVLRLLKITFTRAARSMAYSNCLLYTSDAADDL